MIKQIIKQIFFSFLFLTITLGGCGDFEGNYEEVETSVSNSTDNSTDSSLLTVSSTYPSDNATSVSISDNISVTFSKEMNKNSLTSDQSSINCNGTIQVSSDNFSTCLSMLSSPSVSNSNKTFTVDPSDNLSYSTNYKIRVTTGAIDISGNNLSEQFETLSGFTTWSGTRQLGTSSQEIAYGLSLDSSKNIYIAGYTSGGLDGNSNSGDNDTFLVKYDPNGLKQWTKQLGTSSDEIVWGLSVDLSDNIYITGYTDGGLDGNTNLGSNDAFFIKYNSQGIKQWTKQIGTSLKDYGASIVTDSSNNIYLAGETYGGLDGNTNSGGYDAFLIKYNSDAVVQWTKQLGTSSNDVVWGTTIDSLDNIYVTGYTEGGLEGNNNSGGLDMFVFKYSSSGTNNRTKLLGTSSDEVGYGISVDSSDNIYVVGETEGGLDGYISSGGKDIIVIKYNSNLTKQWSQQIGTSNNESGRAVAVDSLNNIYVTGYTFGGLDGNTNLGSSDIFLMKFNSSGVKQ